MRDDPSNYNFFGIDFGADEAQRDFVKAIQADPERLPVVYCKGQAGTGKTFTALATSLAEIRGLSGRRKRYKTLFYIREPVEIGHKLGYLKGTEDEKLAPYLGPLLDNYASLMNKAKDAGLLNESLKTPKPRRTKLDNGDDVPSAYMKLPSDIVPLAPEFMRGRTFEDAIFIVDEAQNMTLGEIHTLLTRIGERCKMIIVGSANQIDVPGQTLTNNAFLTSYEIIKETGLATMVELTKPMRSGFVVEFDRLFSEYESRSRKEAK